MATLDEYSATPRPYFSLEKDDYVTQVIPSGSSPTGWTNLRGQPVDVKGGTIDGMPAEEVGRIQVGPATAQVGIPQSAVPTSSIFNNPLLKQLTSGLSSVTDKLYEEANKNPLQPGAMTTDQLLKAGYKLGTTTAYDSDIGYYEVPTWVDSKGNNIGLSPQQVAANDRAYEAQVRAAEETHGNFRYIGYGADPEGNNPIGYVKVPKASSAYRTPESISSNPVFQDVNAYSSGQLGRIVDAINSGEYKITDDKSQMVTPYGSYALRPLGNGLYDIPIGARSGSYNVAIGVNDKGEAQFDKKFLDAGAIRYQGGSSGSFLQNFVQDAGPLGNIALAVATGGASIPTQIAAQTAYNMVGGADFEDALTRGALNVGLSQGIQGLTGGASLGSTDPADYAGLQSGLGGGEFYNSLGAGADDIMTSIGGVGQMGGATTGGIGDFVTSTTLPKTDYSLSSGKEGLGLKASAPTTTVPDFSEFSEVGGVDYSIYEPGSGGGLGLKPGVAGNLASMGGGQGLTAPAFGQPGSIVSEGGINTGLLTAEGLGGNLGKELAAINTGVPTTNTGIAGLTAADDVAAQQAAANAIVPAGAGAGVADLAGTTAGAGMAGAAGAAGAGLTAAEMLKYAGLASLAAGLLGGGQSAGGGGGGGVDQTPVGARLSPDYKPYRYMPYAGGGIVALADGGRADTTNVSQPQGMTPLRPVPPPPQQPQRTFAGAKPNIKEFMDATGVDFATASDVLYGTVGSNIDTRNWKAIFSSQDPLTAARQATAAMYGGVKPGTYIDPITGKQSNQLIGTSGYYPLTTPGGRDVNFGVGLNTDLGKNFITGLSTNPTIDAMRAAAGIQQAPIPIQSQPLIAPQAQQQVAQTIAVQAPRFGAAAPSSSAYTPVNIPVVNTQIDPGITRSLSSLSNQDLQRIISAMGIQQPMSQMQQVRQAPQIQPMQQMNRVPLAYGANAFQQFVPQAPTQRTVNIPPSAGIGALGAARYKTLAGGGMADGGYNLGGYSDGGRLLRGPGDGVSDDIPASIGGKQPARLADGEFVIPARIVSEIGNGSTDAGARKLYQMMDRVQSARRKTMGKKQFAKDTKADKYFPA